MKTSVMKNKLAIGCVVLSALFPAAAFSRGGGASGSTGGGGMHSGGAAGTSPTAPGTNSSGTALSSSGTGSIEQGAALGTGDPSVDAEDRKAVRMISSVCRGC